MLTGKAKQIFDEWMQSLPYKFQSDITGVLFNEITFNSLPLSMQWGVYQQWADSMGYDATVRFNWHYRDYTYEIVSKNGLVLIGGHINTREEAQKAAIEKLNDLINKR